MTALRNLHQEHMFRNTPAAFALGFIVFLSCLTGGLAFAQQKDKAPAAGDSAVADGHPITQMKRLIGAWRVFPRAGESSDSVNEWQWTNQNRAILKTSTIYAGNPFIGNREGPEQISQGLIGFNPETSGIVGYTFQTLTPGAASVHFMFASAYWFPDENTIIRLYTVSYPDNDPRVPLPDIGGNTRSYREIYRFMDNNTIRWTTDIQDKGEWKNFGPNPDGSILRRITD